MPNDNTVFHVVSPSTLFLQSGHHALVSHLQSGSTMADILVHIISQENDANEGPLVIDWLPWMVDGRPVLLKVWCQRVIDGLVPQVELHILRSTFPVHSGWTLCPFKLIQG